MKYSATALCLILISFDFQSSLYCVRMRATHFFNRRAVSYFCQSFSPCTNIHREAIFFIKKILVKYVNSHILWPVKMKVNFEKILRLCLGTACTLILELGFNMMYLMEPWMFSVQDASQVTLLSWRTSFHFVPGGGLGCLESLQKKTEVEH